LTKWGRAAARTAGLARARFLPLLWHADHPDRLALCRLLPRDHLAREIDAAVADLDWTALFGCYRGRGSDAHPPELFLRVVLYETRCGRSSPAQGHRLELEVTSQTR